MREVHQVANRTLTHHRSAVACWMVSLLLRSLHPEYWDEPLRSQVG